MISTISKLFYRKAQLTEVSYFACVCSFVVAYVILVNKFGQRLPMEAHI